MEAEHQKVTPPNETQTITVDPTEHTVTICNSATAIVGDNKIQQRLLTKFEVQQDFALQADDGVSTMIIIKVFFSQKILQSIRSQPPIVIAKVDSAASHHDWQQEEAQALTELNTVQGPSRNTEQP